jgi:GNAT superfamily N-acetyltransferase
MEYLTTEDMLSWCFHLNLVEPLNKIVNNNFGVNFDIKSMLDEDMQKLDKFLPPTGRLLLAKQDQAAAGFGCLKKLKDDIGEIKRMYVRPKYRRMGIGKAILERLLVEAAEVGYSRVWLDIPVP